VLATLLGKVPEQNAFVLAVEFQFPTTGQYEVWVTRINGAQYEQNNRINDQVVVQSLRSHISAGTFNLPNPHTMLSMKVIASEKVSGVVQNLSAIVTSVLPVYDANGNVLAHVPTRNPAWIALDILLGESNPRPLNPAVIDWT
jgi:hypothetical protein